MVTPSAGLVVTVQFPFSDLSQSKLRPAVVLADAGRADWILCQITSKPYADPNAVQLEDEDFASGSLRLTSYARPGKLFTANISLMATEVGKLKDDAFRQVAAAVVRLLQSHTP
ncbi:MAG: type II toxin-antitoxin system PemK/MazF family toxin [Caldilineaceae bacterium]|jgi:mRNA interferase MazF|nr:type II toxin-antitoxin system PemK/MazF family toxin [Caldilineaceae bacterium]